MASIDVAALREAQKKAARDPKKWAALQAQIDAAEPELGRQRDIAELEEKEAAEAAEAARRKAWDDAMGAAADKSGDYAAIFARLAESIDQFAKCEAAAEAKLKKISGLVLTGTGKHTMHSELAGMLRGAVFTAMCNHGLQVRGYGPDQGARTPLDIGKLALGQIAGEIRQHGKAKGYA